MKSKLTIATLLVSLTLASVVHARPAPEHGYFAARDGTSLAYLVSLPDAPMPTGGWPVLFTYDGYAAGGVEDTAYADQFVPLGYALVGVSIRGTGCSAGKFDFFEPVEALDGVDAIKWIAGQPWSNGKVGMIGKSYPGITQLFTAEACADDLECSAHLVTVAPGHYYGDAYRDVAYPGGIFNYGFAALWSFVAQPEPGEADALQRIAGGDLQCAQNRVDHLQNVAYNPFLQAQEHMFDDPLIRERSPIYDAGKIKVPVYMANAWQDEQLGPRATYLVERLTSAPFYRQLLGNGSHGLYRWARNLGTLQAWFDHYLKGVDNGIDREPRVQIWFDTTTSAANVADGWRLDFNQWPLPDSAVTPLTLFLGSGGKLTANAPAAGEAPDAYLYPGGTESRGGEDINSNGFPSSVHQFKNDGYSLPTPPATSVSYMSDPLAEDVVVLGTIRATLFVASTAVDTDFQVSLSEVRENGDVEYVQKGWLRASHRKLVAASDPNYSPSIYRPVHSHRQEDMELLTPGTVAEIDVEIPPVGHAFRAGERIRVDIEMPSIAPELWAFLPLPIPAVNLVHHDAANPSRILLPTKPVSVNGIPSPLPTEPACGSRIRQPCRAAAVLGLP